MIRCWTNTSHNQTLICKNLLIPLGIIRTLQLIYTMLLHRRRKRKYNDHISDSKRMVNLKISKIISIKRTENWWWVRFFSIFVWKYKLMFSCLRFIISTHIWKKYRIHGSVCRWKRSVLFAMKVYINKSAQELCKKKLGRFQ